MSSSTRDRIAAAFDRELAASPVPPALRSAAVHGAVTAPRPSSAQEPRLLALVAAILAIAVIATIVLGAHLSRSVVPSRPGVPTAPPLPRTGASLVFDQARGELVLFGGDSGSGGKGGEAPSTDVLTWDGKGWRLVRTTSAPSARRDGVMAYDAAHHDAVLFGGVGLGTTTPGAKNDLEDTWTWNGSSWRRQHPQHSPAFSFAWPATMAFDPASNQVLLYGFTQTTAQVGGGTSTSMVAETWSWNGSDWKQLAPVTSPNQEGEMVASDAHAYLIALASSRVGGRYVSQTWQWSGTTWTLLGPSNDWLGMPGSAAFDVPRRELVAVDADTWTWDGSAWTRQHPTVQPDTGYMAYFAPLHEVVSWGARYSSSNNDLWAWSGSNWSLVQKGNVEASPPSNGRVGPTTPAAAETYVRQSVTSSSPVLLPAWLPAGMDATVVDGTPDFFTVTYASDQRDKTISFGIMLPQPPPSDAKFSDTLVRFRNSAPTKFGANGYAEYFVYDTTAPRSDRWLMWYEPGRMVNPQTKEPGVVPYFLSASGLTDQEFWQVASSLQ